MRLRLNISQKGLVLVAVPLISGLVFLGVLFGLLRQAEAEILEQVQVKMVIFQAATLSRLFNDAGVAAAGYELTKSEIFSAPFDAIRNRIRKEFQQLEHSQLRSFDVRNTLQRMEADAAPALAGLTQAKQSIDAGKDVDIAWLIHELNIVAKKMSSELNRLTAEDKQLESEGSDPSGQTRKTVQLFLLAGVALNLGLTLLLARFFSRSITGRLKVLTDNAERFAHNEKLHDPLPGDDEIADLDRVFHNMAAAVRESEQRKQEFVSIVSHDLKTPLTSLQMFLSMLGEGFYGELNEKGKQNVEACERSTDRLLNLIRDLLDIERLSAGKMDLEIKPVSISDVINRSVEAVEHFAQEQGVKLAVPENDAQALGDSDRLVQVLVNLLSNSIKFSPPGGQVEVTVKQSDGFVEVRVIDQGRGVPEHMREAIFERFKQVDIKDAKEKKGTGLGLPICKAIVEQHNGSIGVESEDGKGSTFWFRLPAIESAT